ncbi:hypothetical protein BGZ76_006737 [Entomortierella beljakovae]|nr:hypothetical protein BGZ76_006737 [Entomortierella beljakovae]
MSQSRLYSNLANYDSDTDTEVTGRRTSNRRTGGRTENQRNESNTNNIAPSEPPPTYEQSLFTSHVPAWFPNPFQRNSRSSIIAPQQAQEDINHPTPLRLTPQNSPSAPPVSLMTSTPSLPSPSTGDESPIGLSSASLKRGKRPVRDRHTVGSSDDNEEFIFRAQPPVSSGFTHPSDTSSASSPLSTNQRGYFDSLDTNAQRTNRRLEHKQAYVQLGASAPELNQLGSFENDDSFPTENRRTVVPAPPSRPSRLLQFRSREPSAVRSCPFPLCKKPIKATRTRRQRGAAVWIACGLLFLCNTYWTIHVVVDYFTASSRDRVLSHESQTAIAASSKFAARKEAAHLVKGLLGLKSQRYHDPNVIKHQRYLSGLDRPTVASVGIITDDQGYWKALLSLWLIATMAMVRWVLCLSPLIFRFLFDTVHSCPHPHPYPYPNEIEKERKLLGEFDLEGIQNILPLQDKLEAVTQWYGGDEKRILREKDETDARSSSRSYDRAREASANDFDRREGKALVPIKDQPASESSPSRFRFFNRILEIRRDSKEKAEQARLLAASTVDQLKKKKIPAAIYRTISLEQSRRLRIIKATQDIGRYSLLYEVEYYIRMEWWKQAVAPARNFQRKEE